MANEGLYITILALMLIGVLLYALASTRHSSFAASQEAVKFYIYTPTGVHSGVKDLISDFDYFHNINSKPLYWTDEQGMTYVVKLEQLKASQLPFGHIQIVVKNRIIAEYDNGETKNSVWHSSRHVTQRSPEFIALLKDLLGVTAVPDPTVTTPKNNRNPDEYAYYVTTKTYDKSIVHLVRALNERVAGATKVFRGKSSKPLPVRFYAAIDGNLKLNDLVVYSDHNVPIFQARIRDQFKGDGVMSPDEKVALFEQRTKHLSLLKFDR